MKKKGATTAVLASLKIPPSAVHEAEPRPVAGAAAAEAGREENAGRPPVENPAASGGASAAAEAPSNAVSATETLPAYLNRKISVSLFAADLEAVDRLIVLLWERCRLRATPSDAIKMALRFAAAEAPPEALQGNFHVIKHEDGRRRNKINPLSS